MCTAPDFLVEAQPAEQSCDRHHTVLIVDDDELASEALAWRLKRLGFHAVVADSGQTGLDAARSLQPDLVLLDLRLPDVDGLTVCRQLSDAAETCTIPIIILSAAEGPDLLRRCREAGCQFYLRKPYDPNVLLTIIRQAIANVESWRDAG